MKYYARWTNVVTIEADSTDEVLKKIESEKHDGISSHPITVILKDSEGLGNFDERFKPCPFCGERPYVNTEPCGFGLFLCCHNPECLIMTCCYDTEEKLLEVWNRRQ